jgi:hypothetical protein
MDNQRCVASSPTSNVRLRSQFDFKRQFNLVTKFEEVQIRFRFALDAPNLTTSWLRQTKIIIFDIRVGINMVIFDEWLTEITQISCNAGVASVGRV